jgi:hypothetical protein
MTVQLGCGPLDNTPLWSPVMTTADRTYLCIPCPSCGELVAASIAWLVSRRSMLCTRCKKSIDLMTGENGIAVRETAFNCERVDARIARL